MYAIAVETPPPEASPLAAALRRRIAVLEPACPDIERACHQSGEQLGETIPVFGERAALFEALAADLSGDAFAAVTDDLDLLTGELARAADDLAEEGRTLGRLAEASDAIGKRIEDLLGFTRTMSWLVFTLKIESAPLTRLSSDMIDFAENIHRLAETTRRALEDYHATHFRLETLLSAARAAQGRFQAEHQTRLVDVAADLRENLDHATERRLAAIAGLRHTAAQARQMAARVGENAVALQIGDRTRQRVEHAHGALDMIAAALEGDPSPVLGRLSMPETEALAARACLLQARQIQGARSEYSAQARDIIAALEGLAGESDAWAAEGRDLFGAGEAAEGSFLAVIEARLITAREALAHFGGARAAVDEAARSVVAIVEDMRQRTAALTDHIVDVTIIGTNALLRSTRLGDQGKGVALIARELRAYGEQTGAIIRSLPEALDGVVELAAGLSRGGRLDAASIAGLQTRMSAAIDIFGASHRKIAAALAALGDDANEGRARVVAAADLLRASAETDAGLSLTEEGLEALGRDQSGLRRADLDLTLDALLLPLYTMDCERVIHADFSGAGRPRAAPKRAARGDVDLVESILL